MRRPSRLCSRRIFSLSRKNRFNNKKQIRFNSIGSIYFPSENDSFFPSRSFQRSNEFPTAEYSLADGEEVNPESQMNYAFTSQRKISDTKRKQQQQQQQQQQHCKTAASSMRTQQHLIQLNSNEYQFLTPCINKVHCKGNILNA